MFVRAEAPAPSEAALWSLALQLLSAAFAVHSLGMSCRGIEPARIILTSGTRARLNGVGVLDLTRPDPRPLPDQQRDDLSSLGRLLVNLACRSPGAASSKALPKSLELMATWCSPDLVHLASELTAGPAVSAVLPLVSARLMDHAIALQAQCDSLRERARAEAENGRIARLLIKLGFVNERPEFADDPAWAETGDRYLLKLLRDAIFHAVDESGAPVVSYPHVVSALNKLDLGVDEYLMLHGRDDSGSLMVVSYRDMRSLLERTFADLVAAQQASPLQHAASDIGLDVDASGYDLNLGL